MHKIFHYATGTAMTVMTSVVVSPASSAAVTPNFEVNRFASMALPNSSDQDDNFEDYMAATLDMSEPDAGSWEEIKAQLGL